MGVALAVVLDFGGSEGAPGAEIEVRRIPEEIRQGQAFLVSVSCSTPFSSVIGEWKKSRLPFYREKADGTVYSGVFGIDLAARPGRTGMILHVTPVGGQTLQLAMSFAVLEEAFPAQHLTLPPGMVTLSSKNLARVRREQAEIAKIWQSAVQEKIWNHDFIPPLEGKVLSEFGLRRYLNGKPRNPHTGVDFRAKAGSPVHASSEGIVAYTGEHFFAGKSVYLDHGRGIFTMYFHLSEVTVKRGQMVHQGDVIGLVGQTGRATGPHLHWGVRIRENRVDPFSLIEALQGLPGGR
jgi:hypothetical protein